MTNLLGIPIEDLDVTTFLAACRVAFVLSGVFGAVLIARTDQRRAGRILLGVAILGQFLAWLATMFPLPNVYGANGSQDRENHLGWANVVALGFSPLRTFQVNHLHFEPVWPLVTAIVSGFDIDRVPMIFQCAPLIMGIAVLCSVHFAWMRGSIDRESSGLAASFAALGAVLLTSVPEDFTGPFRNPWALSFLLKPNHALGLVLTPLALLGVARARDWKSRLVAGFVLQLVGWAFVIHMVLVVAGLFVYVALSWLSRHEDRAKDLKDVAWAVGINALIVSPYLVILLVGYPIPSSDFYRLSPFTDRVIEAPLRLGLLFALSAFGAWRAWRGGDRIHRLFATQWLAAHIVWQAFPLLGLIGQAREQDEAFYWCRFWTGLFASFGLLECMSELGRRATKGVSPALSRTRGAAAALIVLLPALLPTFWAPDTMDQYFVAARKPIPDWIAEPTRFIRSSTPTNAVFAGDRTYARWIAAYGGRRVLVAYSLNAPSDIFDRQNAEAAVLHGGVGPDAEVARRRYGVQYVLVTSRAMDQDQTVTIDSLRTAAHLQSVFDRQFTATRVAIFKVTP